MKYSASLVDFLNLYKSQHPKDVFLVNEEIKLSTSLRRTTNYLSKRIR